MFANKGNPLAKLKGPFGTTGDNRNDYAANANAWKHAFADEMWKEKIMTGGVPGRLDHVNKNESQNENDETLLQEACILVKQTPQISKDGRVNGEAYILDNEAGQLLYALCKAGKKPGISYRGSIDDTLFKEGDTEGAWNEFTIEGLDVVFVPAYEEAYLEMVEDYLDGNKQPKIAASAKNTASAVMRVAASKKDRKRIIAKLGEYGIDPDSITNINKEIEKMGEVYKKDIADKAKAISKQPDINPKHIFPKEEGNITHSAHDEPSVYGKDDIEDIITGKPIDTLTKGNEDEEETKPVYPLKVAVEKLNEQKTKASATIADIEKKVKEIGKGVAEDMVDDATAKEIDKKTKSILSGIKEGMASADTEKDEDEQLEGHLDKDGNVIKKTKAGMLGVASGEETPEDKKKEGELGKGGKVNKQGFIVVINIDGNEKYIGFEGITNRRDGARTFETKSDASIANKTFGSLGTIEKIVKQTDKKDVNASDVERMSDMPIDYDTDEDLESVNDESDEAEGNINSDDMGVEEILQSEITRLSELNEQLQENVNSLKELIDNRNTELGEVEARYNQLKSVTAKLVDDGKQNESRVVALRERNIRMASVEANQKKESQHIVAALKAQVKEQEKVIAGLESDRDVMNRTMQVQAQSQRELDREHRVLAGKNDTLGKLAVNALADIYGISKAGLLEQRARIRTGSDLEKVIASLQKRTTRSQQVMASSYRMANEERETYGDIPPELMEILNS